MDLFKNYTGPKCRNCGVPLFLEDNGRHSYCSDICKMALYLKNTKGVFSRSSMEKLLLLMEQCFSEKDCITLLLNKRQREMLRVMAKRSKFDLYEFRRSILKRKQYVSRKVMANRKKIILGEAPEHVLTEIDYIYLERIKPKTPGLKPSFMRKRLKKNRNREQITSVLKFVPTCEKLKSVDDIPIDAVFNERDIFF